ncbi:MAG: efflux RND transporter periplasmic adaptor subunit, partial [Pseudomonadota bacterium]
MQKTILIVAATLVILTGCGDSQPQQQSQQMPPPEVDVVQPLTKEIALWDEFTGRFIPLKSVELRSRVSGFLVEQRFKDGDIVEQGQVLFVVDPRP